MPDLLIDPKEVNEVFLSCLYTEREIEDVEGVPEGAVLVEGIQNKFGFHPGRLEENREKVKKWLEALPRKFRRDVGGGWSFLKACDQQNGVQWTGFHERMDQLFCLGIGLGMVESRLPKNMWSTLPGFMPYYVIDVGTTSDDVIEDSEVEEEVVIRTKSAWQKDACLFCSKPAEYEAMFGRAMVRCCGHEECQSKAKEVAKDLETSLQR